MSFSHLMYDADAYAVDLKQSTAPLQWQLDPNQTNSCKPCFPADVGYLGRQGVSINKNQSLIDTESNLKLLNYRNSRNPAMKYQPNQIAQAGGSPTEDNHNYSDCTFHTDYSRLTNPACTLRGTGVNRFQPMCLNFQDENRWLHPGKVGTNYRMVVKDNHRPRIPVPMDQSASLPDPNAPAPETMPRAESFGAFTGPMHEFYINLKTTPYSGMDC